MSPNGFQKQDGNSRGQQQQDRNFRSNMTILSDGFSDLQVGQQFLPNQNIPFNYLDDSGNKLNVSHAGQNNPGLAAPSQAVPCAKNAGNEQKELSSNLSQQFGENIFLAKN